MVCSVGHDSEMEMKSEHQLTNKLTETLNVGLF